MTVQYADRVGDRPAPLATTIYTVVIIKPKPNCQREVETLECRAGRVESVERLQESLIEVDLVILFMGEAPGEVNAANQPLWWAARYRHETVLEW